MAWIDWVDNSEWLENFNFSKSLDITPRLYNTITDNFIQELWENSLAFYHLVCLPYWEDLQKWESVPGIYKILKDFVPKAKGHTFDVLIFKKSNQWLDKNKEVFRNQIWKNKMHNFVINNPFYTYIIGCFWDESRMVQSVIREFKNKFPEKFRELKHK